MPDLRRGNEIDVLWSRTYLLVLYEMSLPGTIIDTYFVVTSESVFFIVVRISPTIDNMILTSSIYKN